MDAITVLLVLSVINTLITLAIAGTVAKLVRYIGGDQEVPPVKRAPPSGRLVGPDYLDPSVLTGKTDPYADGVTKRPPSRNWDGMSQSDE